MGWKRREREAVIREAAQQTIARIFRESHILADSQVVAHCPFCGSGDIIADSDQTVHCSFCNRAFVVMEQPEHPSTPGIPGVGAPGILPGSDQPDPTDPNQDGGGDPAQKAPAAPGAATAPPAPHNPQTDPAALQKAPPFKMGNGKTSALFRPRNFRTASGVKVNEDDFVAHVAFAIARDEII